MPAFRDLTGQSFGQWLVIGHVGKSSSGQLWLCQCECGTERTIIGDTLKKGLSKSCGCSGKDWCRTHGLSKTPEYTTWAAMIQRCENSKNKWFDRYGGRGITVCEKWRVFENFFADMGARPEGGTLDRINNNGNYEPSNCRWTTMEEQIRNREVTKRLEFRGESKPLAEWAEIVGIPRKIVKDRLLAGWTVYDALTKPMRGHLTHCKHGHEFTGENTLMNKAGVKVCRTCNRLKMFAYRERKKQQKD